MKKLYLFIISILTIVCTSCSVNLKEYKLNLYYMDTYIYVSFYSNNEDKAENIKKSIDNIYKEYHQLSDRYQSYPTITNIYSIYHNDNKDKELAIDNKLYNLLEYALEFEKITNSRFNIQIGGVIDIWKKYREEGNGIPTLKELKKANKGNKIVLLENNKIKNNHPNIDLGAISKGYATEKVGKYLEEQGIKKYLINAGGNVKVGIPNNKEKYSIGVQSPNKDGSLVTIVKGNTISVVTSGGYERNYTYEGKTYSHIIDSNTLYPAEYMKSVTVVTKDSALGDALSTSLFLMTIEEGLDFIKDFEAEAIWVTNDNEVIRSEGFSNYE